MSSSAGDADLREERCRSADLRVEDPRGASFLAANLSFDFVFVLLLSFDVDALLDEPMKLLQAAFDLDAAVPHVAA